jgi:hypothetical protein
MVFITFFTIPFLLEATKLFIANDFFSSQLAPTEDGSVASGGYALTAALNDPGCSSCEKGCGDTCQGGDSFPRPPLTIEPMPIGGTVLSAIHNVRFTSATVTELSLLAGEKNQVLFFDFLNDKQMWMPSTV